MYNKIFLKKQYFIMIAFLAIIACGGNKDTVKLDAITTCNFPDSPKDKAPLWVCGALVEGIAVQAVGITEKSKAGINFMQQQALVNARVLLAQQLKVSVNNTVKSFMQSSGVTEQENIDKVASVLNKQITSETIQGSKLYRTEVSPNGAMYVLVGLDKDFYKKNLNTLLNNSNQAELAKYTDVDTLQQLPKSVE